MHIKSFILASLTCLAFTSASFAACRTIVTPDNAPNVRSVVVGQSSSGPDHNGTAYTKATFCPKLAAPGTCTGESLSTFVAGPVYGNKTFLDGNVPDNRQNGILIPATRWTPEIFIPVGPVLVGAC
jgi:hypothetical protein